MKRRNIWKSGAAGVLSAAMVVTMCSFAGFQGKAVAASEFSSPETCTEVTTEEGGYDAPILEVNDGAASKYGLQNTKTVDVNGHIVDITRLTNTENLLGNGVAQEILENSGDYQESYIPSDVKESDVALAAANTGTSYSSSVRNQGSWGVCWSFAATAAAEANIVKNANNFTSFSYTKSNIDLSERHMAWFAHNTFSTHKNDTAYGDGAKKTTPSAAYTGGNDSQAMGYLIRGSGFATEADAPYDSTSAMKGLTEAERYSSVAQLKDFIRLGSYKRTPSSISSAISTVKEYINTYGAVTTSYFSDNNYYKTGSDGRNSYYSSHTTTNHAVCLVGWDDNYAASNFKITPPGNGAWLARNSWGSNWSKDGYFWISYYEPSLSHFSVYNMRDVKDFGRAYSYTAAGKQLSMTIGRTEVTAANVYTCKEDENLKSVGIFTESANVQVEIMVYVKDGKMDYPTDGTLKGKTTVSSAGMNGFHVFDLSSAVSLKQGQRFSIIVTIKKASSDTSGASMYFAAEGSLGKASAGQSYYLKYVGGTGKEAWDDAKTAHYGKNTYYHNACIYAYTSDKDNADKVSSLQTMVNEAKALKEADVKALSGTEEWTALQTELTRAEKVLSNKEAQALDRELRTLKRILSMTGGKNLYANTGLTEGVGSGGVELYLNGGSVKKDGVTVNYKTKTLVVSFPRVNSIVVKKKKATWAINGKYVAVVTSSKNKPTIANDGTIVNPDTAAAAKIGVKFSGNKVTISPKGTGDVYLWVAWVPISASGYSPAPTVESQWATGYAMTKIHVNEAPTAVKLYRTANVDPTNPENLTYTSQTIPEGGSTEVYVTGTTGSIVKGVNTLKEIANTDIGYNAAVASKFANYVTIDKDSSNKRHFTIRVKSGLFAALKTKDGSTATVDISFVCDKNGKKSVFKAVVSNPVKTMTLEKIAASSTETTVSTGGNKIINVVMPSAKTQAQTVTFLETVTSLYDSSRKKTDGVTIFRLPDLQYSLAANSKIAAKNAIGTEQKKVTMAAVKGKAGQYTITAPKGTQGGTELYMIFFHNSYTTGGYQIIKVTVGTANHNKTIKITKDDSNSTAQVTPSGDSRTVNVVMESAVSAAKSVVIKEEVTAKDNNTLEGTDKTLVYRLASKTDGFTVSAGNDVIVKGTPTKAQKKIGMTAVKNKPGYFMIKAEKGTPEGTEVYFLLYHNKNCYSIITVKVGA